MRNAHQKKPARSLYLVLGVAAVVWTLVFVGLAAWEVLSTEQHTEEVARAEALAHLQKDFAFRLWATKHGGVYVPVDEDTPPNPFLAHVPERDLTTPSGRKLTLMNPAYMLRQVMEDYSRLFRVRGHITSLRPLRPANAPDPWEREALEAFERGEDEFYEIAHDGAVRELRIMRPLVTEQGCLKCHAGQGYEVGDIRGGVSVTFPFEELDARGHATMRYHIMIYAGAWLFGIFGLVLSGRVLARRMQEQLTVEQELELSYQRLATLLDALPDLLFELDGEGRILDYRAPTDSALYVAPEAFLGRRLSDVLPGDAATEIMRAVNEAWRGAPSRATYSLQMEGKKRWFEVSVAARQTDTAHPAGAVALVRDVSARHRAVLAQERLATVIDRSADGVIITDPEGVAIYTNPAHHRMSGQTRGESRADAPEDEAHQAYAWPFDGETLSTEQRTAMAATLARGEAWSATVRRLRPDGSHFDEECSVGPVLGEEGAPENFVIISRDATERVREAERRRAAQKLEALGTLAGGIAHDFNNILGAIMGYAELTRILHAEGTKGHDYLEQTLAAARRAKDLVQEILLFGRPQEHTRETVDLATVVHEAVRFLRASFPSTIEIDIELEEGPCTVVGDPSQLHQVVMNLGTNAMQAMSAGGTLTVRITKSEVDEDAHSGGLTPGSYWLLSVSDTGPGIPDTILPRIFDPYFSTRVQGEGSGLGLSVVHGIVRAHAGALTVSTEQGKGTTFEVYLPQGQGCSSTPQALVHPPQGDEHVLLVDDEEALVTSGTALLRHLGYSVSATTSSVDALQRFLESPESFDLLITDLTMPKLTGLELAIAIREQRPELPIIVCTGYSDTFDGASAAKMGLSFLLKPVCFEDLAQAVRATLDRPGSEETT